MKKYLSLIFCFLYMGMHAQEPAQVFSPEAAGLGKYGQVPVNYFNGLPEITIPLTTFKAKGYELPIYLSYHASGNKTDSHPGWVGLGWTLHAGGVINRIVKGYKDEKSEAEFYYLSGVKFSEEFAYYYRAELVQASSNWSDESKLSERNKNHSSGRSFDTEPDEFQISIDDIQASFYIVGNNKVKIKSKSSANFTVSIRLDTSNSTHVLYKNTKGNTNISVNLFTYISEIIITKDNGIKYYFGGDKNAIEFSFMQYPEYSAEHNINKNEWKAVGIANSWLLTKIELTNGEIVEFDYVKNGTPIVMSDNHFANAYVLDENQAVNNAFDTKQQPGNYYNISFIFIQPSYLNSIKSKVTKNDIFFRRSKTKELEYNITKEIFDYRVGNFDYFDPGNPKEFSFTNLMAHNYYMQLDQILEKNKSIRFKYSDDSQSRLKLLSVSFLTNNEQIVNNYTLAYNSLKLPSYNSKQSDKWGYYNNKYYGGTSYENLSAYRTSNEISMQAEVLTSITYPTGGKSEFIYQAHRYSKVAEQFDFFIKPMSGIAGGLRVKEIKNTENGKTSIRKFEYIDSLGNSSGILSGNHLYYANGRQHVKFHYGDWWGTTYLHIKADYKATYYIMQESNINQLSTTNGNHVTYNRITEKLPDGSKTIYTYSNHDKFTDEIPVKMLDNINNEVLTNSFISKELERGLLLKTEFFNKYGTPVKTEINTYNSSPERYDDFVKSINQMHLFNHVVERISALKIYTFYPYLESKTTVIYDATNNKSFTSTAKFEYNAHKLLAKKATINSKGEEEVDLIRYTGDIQSGIYTQMKDKNMISFPVEKTSVRNNKVVHSSLSTYKKNARNSDYVVEKEYKAILDFPLPYNQFIRFTAVSKDSHYNLPEVEYTKYDNYSNINEYRAKDFHPTTCFWGYNSTYPIAVFEGARNDYKITAQYKDVWTTERVALKHNASYQNAKEYTFYTSKFGSVEFHLSGAMGYNWYVTGSFDGSPIVQLVQVRTSYTNEPWWRYQNAYSYKVVVNNVSPGYHVFRINATNSYKNKDEGESDGDLSYSYWKSESTTPEITGNDDVFYENFEDTHLESVVPFGFHSSRSCTGPYTVTLPINPQKNYTIDYQIFRNGTWNYASRDFRNSQYTINEGNDPIDEVRVYPKGAIATSFTYFPFVGLRSKTNGGYTESYEYEPYGRLASIKDNNQKTIKTFNYKYHDQASETASSPFYNIEIRKEFKKQDCDSLRGEIGQFIQYTVPDGKYSSTISQEAANRKAYDDLIKNGQQYANENGECTNNIILSVYNPYDFIYTLKFMWGIQGNIQYENYQITPSDKIADTGDILQDYKPMMIQLPRRNYRSVSAARESNNSEHVELSIEAFEYTFDLFYDINSFLDFRDTYVIGGYPFPR